MQHTTTSTLLSFTLAFGLLLLPQPGHAIGASSQSAWRLPLGSPLRISAPYDLANGPFQAGHRGIDMPTATAAQVTSPTNGVVSFAGTVVDRPVLSIQVDEHTIASFEPITSTLEVGDVVARGDPLGTVSTGGHCRSECLHLGVRVNGAYVNPIRFLVGRAVLVPW